MREPEPTTITTPLHPASTSSLPVEPYENTMGMHGDLVNGLCYTLFIPAYLWLWLSHPEPEPGARLINALFLLVASTSWISWRRGSCVASFIASVSMAGSIAAMNLYQWPHKGEIVIFPQYLWSLLIVSFNRRLPFWVKMGITANALGMALFVSVKSPLIEVGDALPTLLGATALHVLFHYFKERTDTITTREPERKKERNSMIRKSEPEPTTITTPLQHRVRTLFNYFSERKSPLKGGEDFLLDARLASILLAGAFAYNSTLELSKMMQQEGYAVEGGFAILKSGLFAALGLAAAGGFKRTVDMKEALEALVLQRTEEIALQAEELRMLEVALQASETAVAITDSFLAVVWSNTSLERLVANHAQQVRGCPLTKVLGPSPEMADRLSACFGPKHVCMTEIAIEDAFYSVEVSPFPASGFVSCSSSSDCDPNDSRFLVVLKDVTEQRARERAEKLAEKELFLKQAMEGTMETVTHELRTPLQGIMGMASAMLYETSISDETRESLSLIMASSRHLLMIINNLLNTRTFDAKMTDKFPLSPIPLASSMLDAINFCRPMAAITQIDLKLALDPFCDQKVQVLSDTIRLQQVLINLVSNSIKYAPPSSSVRLTSQVMTYQQARESMMEGALALGIPIITDTTDAATRSVPKEDIRVAVVSVCDSGPGISEDVADKLFRKFAKVVKQPQCPSCITGGNPVVHATGTGLGLHLCVKFVERMNGNIWVSNNKDGGACFAFFIPIVEADPTQEPTTATTITTTTTPQTLSSSSHPPPSSVQLVGLEDTKESPRTISDMQVLIVDDIIINLKVLERMLRGIGICKVATADSGKKALSLLEKEKFDLVITDIQMPEMDGLQLAAAIRRNDKLPVKPIMVGLTAGAESIIPEGYAKSGLSLVLHKPSTLLQLQSFFRDTIPTLQRCDEVGTAM